MLKKLNIYPKVALAVDYIFVDCCTEILNLLRNKDFVKIKKKNRLIYRVRDSEETAAENQLRKFPPICGNNELSYNNRTVKKCQLIFFGINKDHEWFGLGSLQLRFIIF